MTRADLITQAEYARRRGCAKSAVCRAVKEGRITLVDGKVDPVAADREWSANSRARGDSAPASAPPPAAAPAPAPPAPAAPNDYQLARARREQADAERAEIEVAKMAGRLVDRARVEAAVFDAFRSLRDRVMNVPRRCASLVVGLTDAREIEMAIADELRAALGGSDDQVGRDLAQKVSR